MSKSEDAKDIIEAAAKLTENVPIYQDALQPVAKEAGKALSTVGRAVNAALLPLKGIVWGAEKIEQFLATRLPDKLKEVPAQRIQQPSLLVAGPIIQALQFAADDEVIREMYANLLAASMDKLTKQNAHPAFVEMIQSMTPDEARIMRYMASREKAPIIDLRAVFPNGRWTQKLRNFSVIGQAADCTSPEMTSNYLDNLIRLGLLEIPHDIYLANLKSGEISEEYDELKNLLEVKEIVEAIELEDKTATFVDKQVRLTDLGRQFITSCVLNIHPEK